MAHEHKLTRGRERERESVQEQWSCIVYWTGLCSLNAVECKGGRSTVWDALNNVGDGEGFDAIGEGLGGELPLLAHEEECKARDVRTGNAIRLASPKLAEKPKQDVTHVAMLVPERTATASSALGLAERMSWPGPRISTADPVLENEAKVSLMVVAPTVMASGRRAGEESFASLPSFPAATMKGMPFLMTLAT